MNIRCTSDLRTDTQDIAPHQADRLNAVVSLTKELNAAIARAADAGLTIEVTRDCRHHTPQRAWGDQLALAVEKTH